MTVVNGRFLGRSPTGVDRFAFELLRELRSRVTTSWSFRIAVPEQATPTAARKLFDADIVRVGSHSGQLWEQLELPRFAGQDPLLNLCNSAPVARELQLVLIHDAGAVANASNYSLRFRTWYRLMHSSVMKRARVVATVSRFSADELTRIYGTRSRGLEILSEGCEHILREQADPAVVERLGLIDRPFVLALGSDSPNKNFRAVAAAAELLAGTGLAFVVAGGTNSRVFATARSNDAAMFRVGVVTDAQLRALYEQATCFVFPSLYEGFGLPPLEAMRCGCPVIASDRASIPEVCGDAALYCDPLEPADLARQIRRILESEVLRSELRERGQTKASQYTWSKAADQFTDILQHHFA